MSDPTQHAMSSDPREPSSVPAPAPAAAGGASAEMPYRLACLCDLRDGAGRVLLLHRLRAPNKDLCSPIGGKLDVVAGESPAQCAAREIMEEAGVEVPPERLHLGGIISERAFEGRGHWLLFYYRVLGPIEVAERRIDEGELRWYGLDELDGLALPRTDREIIWPMIRAHEHAGPGGKPGFFSVHIDCREGGVVWEVEEGLDPFDGGGA